MLEENNLDAASIYETYSSTYNRKYSEKEECCNLSRLEMKANPSRMRPQPTRFAIGRFYRSYVYRPGKFRFIRSRRERSELYNKCWTTCSLSLTVSMLHLSCSDRHVLGLLPCAGLICAALCLPYMLDHNSSCM